MQVVYSQKEVAYKDLLQVFIKGHNPTQKNAQGNDVGTQYRSGIYYHTPEQKAEAEAFLKEAQADFKVRFFKGRTAQDRCPEADTCVDQTHQMKLKRFGCIRGPRVQMPWLHRLAFSYLRAFFLTSEVEVVRGECLRRFKPGLSRGCGLNLCRPQLRLRWKR